MKDTTVVIIGAGLTGLLIAYRLKQKGIACTILEARDKLGGRIQTHYSDNAPPLEMGATWLGKKHTQLNKLLEELSINTFIQELGENAIYEPMSISPAQLVQLPPNSDPSYRIVGGTSTLINKLAEALGEDEIHLSKIVKSINVVSDGLKISGDGFSIKAKQVISTLPPNLFINTINVTPSIPLNLQQIASQTHTWMGESIKVALSYATPFWRAEQMSGTIFSNVGPIPEMYDHSNYEDEKYALKGFLNGSYFSLDKEERLKMILVQLQKYFGDNAKDYLSYEETVWRAEPFTFKDYYDHVLPHQNNGHAAYHQTFLNDKLIIGGAETAKEFSGYMEGAVRSANYILENLISC